MRTSLKPAVELLENRSLMAVNLVADLVSESIPAEIPDWHIERRGIIESSRATDDQRWFFVTKLNGQHSQLWITDGLEKGTKLVSDFWFDEQMRWPVIIFVNQRLDGKVNDHARFWSFL